jgi:hypothetical protein
MMKTATQPVLGIPIPLSQTQISVALATVRQASRPGKVEDGTRVHIQYGAFRKATDAAKIEAARASDLGLPNDRYTGRVSRVWETSTGSLCMNLLVELERDHKYRTLNLSKGRVFQFVVLGD